MSFGSETPNFDRRNSSVRQNDAVGLFDSETGVYQRSRSNVVQFKSKHKQTHINADIDVDKWPAYKSIGFAIAASLTLWSGIAFMIKAIF
ncbi:hypothetical protein [Hirschia baltica]|uniref:Uncharacterized protein n=1 Tax=Hirschia baltica (strain ATCC 49814 / DSM 5838 / IFAM 1418) TaxID=582402 RepID=C6XM43_HIRBI|nr:hypothetical protein [Hirschia baltica]ACT59875.1 hypothetical protein Hbal_2195 [Hirschia baltica ATCC 49814]